ncbi:hypothetical protein AGLY_015187 [Aphis glycines]|uniref:MULE transposase domain-containing protein n=1 Tax=Aphis glycines TaxID=307491 RepID=A0A6G0T1F1_APHGL|nr:hypothetical protein AGLY_015187 [Aphis glycines]
MKEEISNNPTKPVPKAFKEIRRSVITSGIQGATNSEIVDAIPVFTSIRSSGYRKKMKMIPPLPSKLCDLTIEGDWRSTNDGRDFLLGSEGNDDKIIIFGTEGFLKRLCSSEIVFMDGTFKSALKLFMQIYTLHCFVMGVMVPMVYALLPNKSTNTYTRMFNIIKEAALRNDLAFKPKTFQIDFEIGMIVAIRDSFGYNIEIKGCLFHFGQSIWRQVQKVALVPIDEIDECWSIIHAEAPVNEKVIKLMDYFVDTYLNSDACMFDRKIWNHFNTDRTRTTNHLKGWHAALNRSISRPNPNIFVLITEIKNQQQNFELDLQAQKNGNPKPLTKMKFRKLEERLKNAKDR